MGPFFLVPLPAEGRSVHGRPGTLAGVEAANRRRPWAMEIAGWRGIGLRSGERRWLVLELTRVPDMLIAAEAAARRSSPFTIARCAG